MNVWLYHINPKRGGFKYVGWDVKDPSSFGVEGHKPLRWPVRAGVGAIDGGDVICMYIKNIPPRVDGVYIVGRILSVNREARRFEWVPDVKASRQLMSTPIPASTIRQFFPRSFGATLQRLPAQRTEAWMRLLALSDSPVPAEPDALEEVLPIEEQCTDPHASKENGEFGEKYVAKLLAKRYPKSEGFRVDHLSARDKGADHDLDVYQGEQLICSVEVKTRVGVSGDPVLISERELAYRNSDRSRHKIFIVYLRKADVVQQVVEIGTTDAFALKPCQHWLTPEIPPEGGAKQSGEL